jgi:hypothetical protein
MVSEALLAGNPWHRAEGPFFTVHWLQRGLVDRSRVTLPAPARGIRRALRPIGVLGQPSFGPLAAAFAAVRLERAGEIE